VRDDDPTHLDDGSTLDAPIPSAQLSVPSLPAPPRPGSVLEPGSVLGDYRIERTIGKGSMGVVYLGVHQLIGKRAAIKVLRGDSDKGAIDRFIEEARTVNRIGHPNIVDVFAFGQMDDGRAYLVMEWLQGETLRTRLERGHLDVDTTCRIIKPLVRALAAAHAQRIVHRDIKPDNVMLVAGDAPTAKLLDFGMAKLLRLDQMTQTGDGGFVGTPMYVAPEQARGKKIDHRADIYTLGGVMFEMLTGRPPFVARSAFDLISMHLTAAPPRPSEHVQLPRELDDLVVQMLAKDPGARPDISRIAEVIEHVLDPQERPTTPLVAERESIASIAKTLKRPPRPVMPWWLIVLVVALGAVGAYALIRGLLN
jgi:serine/threonine-protein kinase